MVLQLNEFKYTARNKGEQRALQGEKQKFKKKKNVELDWNHLSRIDTDTCWVTESVKLGLDMSWWILLVNSRLCLTESTMQLMGTFILTYLNNK